MVSGKEEYLLQNDPKSLVIVPTYNEVGNVDELIRKIYAHAPNIHVLFVDDNSLDGTIEKIKASQITRPTLIHLIQRAGKMGLGTAYIAGFKWALQRDYANIIEMDADLSHDPGELPLVLELLLTHPVVVGSRYVDGGGTLNWGLFRRWMSRFGSFYGRTILGLQVRDLTGGFNGWRAHVLRAIDPDSVKSGGYSFQIELKYRAFRAGFAIKEFPILFSDRTIGQSKMSSQIVVEAMYRVWQLRHSLRHLPTLETSSSRNI